MSFLVKIYDNTGANYISSITQDEQAKSPKWNAIINGGLGQCVLDLNRPYSDFGEGSSVKHNNVVRIYSINADNPLGELLYTGYISQYVSYSDGVTEGVKVYLLGLYTRLQQTFYNALAGVGGSNLNVTYTAEDPADMIKDTVDNWQTVTGLSLISYSEGLIEDVGQSNTIEFSRKKHLEQIKEIGNFLPEGWFWHINAEGQFILKEKESEPQHKFTLGKDVINFNVQNTSEELVNNLILGHDGGTLVTENAPSIATYGQFDRYERISGVSSDIEAQPIADAILAEFSGPKQSISLTVSKEYDINSVTVGDTCKVLNVPTGSSLDFGNLQIVKIQFSENEITLELDAIRRDYSLALANRIAQG